MHIELIRVAYLTDVTLGYMRVGGHSIYTLEEPWIPNPLGPGGARRSVTHRESCVPDGEYRLYPHTGTRYKGVWCLENQDLGVYRYPSDMPPGQPWGRSAILIHSGNTVEDTVGCILVGMRHGILWSRTAVLESQVALSLLREALGAEAHTLTIRPVRGTSET